ncbi:hypothetical protein K466DRAFT_652930 [Polyporus arcularius HHB13444]|uniref:F-box domain-containing protein n=1 Tax=Polyporus arcularius HHB13444 TaxID=1314778 RepID=A0A5C3PF48_9APHY|nr:hypothetical protein K466DRAFT_652930 [Polyporus arcularius HHB13444]
MQFLPQELQDRIIDGLAPDRVAGPSEHYAELRACALTCQSWLPRAQCQLYKHVEVDRLESTMLFARTLEESPDVCRLVKRLEFWFKAADWKDQDCEDVPFPTHLVGRLVALHGLRFACCTNSAAHTAVQIEFMKLWTVCVQLRTLWVDGFYFKTLADLTRIIWSFPKLEELNVFQTGWAARGIEVDSADFPGRCQMLTTVEMQETHRVDDLLPLLGTTIQNLSIAWMWDASPPDTYAAVSTLHDLRSLVFLVNQIDDPWVTSVLNQVHSTHLEKLVLDLYMVDREEDSEALGLLLSRFDDLLSRKRLNSVIRLKIMTSEQGKTGNAERRLREAQALLPRFLSRGTIEVETRSTA